MIAMRIALFSAYFPPHIGGVEQYTLNLATSLYKKGHEVVVITSNSGNGAKPHVPFEVIEIPTISVMGDRFPVIRTNREFSKLVNKLRIVPFDAYVINTRYYPVSLLGCHLASAQGKKPVIIDHSSGYLTDDKSIYGFTLRLYERIINRAVMFYKPDCYAVSSRSGLWIKSLGFHYCGVIPNAIDVDDYLTKCSDRDWSEVVNQCSGLKVVFIGRLVREKGVQTAIEAVRLLRAQGNRVDLFIAGSGPLANSIAQIRDENIHYVGALSREDACSLLSVSDIFCYPSEYPEGLPSVLLEAASHKLAIVSSNCAGASDVIQNTDSGFIVNDPSPASISHAIQQYCENPALMKSAGMNAFNRVKTSFSWDVSAQLLIDAISDDY